SWAPAPQRIRAAFAMATAQRSNRRRRLFEQARQLVLIQPYTAALTAVIHLNLPHPFLSQRRVIAFRTIHGETVSAPNHSAQCRIRIKAGTPHAVDLVT